MNILKINNLFDLAHQTVTFFVLGTEFCSTRFMNQKLIGFLTPIIVAPLQRGILIIRELVLGVNQANKTDTT